MTEITTKEQFREMWSDGLLEEVDDYMDDSWRHGNNYRTVFEVFTGDSESTGIYYQAFYRVSGDGEYNGIRELDFNFYRVYPHEEIVTVTKTVWKTNPKD